MRILIVGAGAVGQVYGQHLAAGGAEVSVFVKEKYAAEAEAGFVVRGLNSGARSGRFVPAHVLTSSQQIAGAGFDQIWLCISSTALPGPWLDALLASAGDALIVSLTPGLMDRELLLSRVPAARLVLGMIPFSSWTKALPGQPADQDGTCWWMPPAMRCAFSGPRAAEVAKAVKAGGLASSVAKDISKDAALGSAVLVTLMAALEAADWSFDKLLEGDTLAQGLAASREALAVAAAFFDASPGPLGLLARPLPIRLVLWFARRVPPFNMEAFFKLHFTKVGDQTRAALATWIAQGQARALPTVALSALAAKLPE